jgi:cell division inhibitor SepF
VKFLDKLTNILMPMEEVIEEELVEEKPVARKEEAAFSERKVVNGTNAFYTPAVSSRPQLTVHVTKTPELKIQVYVPSKFDQVMEIADDLKNNKAVIVNYERVTTEEQRRICDFINGACYVIDGAAKRISAAMVLYVPNGVSVADAVSKVFG